MKKSLFIFPTILIVVLLILFFIFISKEYKESEYGAVVIEPGENYIIKEVNGETIVENENVGLTFKVPQGWDVEKKELGEGEWIVNLMSPDAEINETGLLIDGCGVSVGVKDHSSSALALMGIIDNINSGDIEVSDDYEIVDISGYEGLRIRVAGGDGSYALTIELPLGERIYMLDTLIIKNTDCLRYFDEIMSGILIN